MNDKPTQDTVGVQQEPLADNVADYRLLYDSNLLRVYHLQGKERTWKIKSVIRATLKDMKQQVSKKPGVYFEDVPLPFILNKTNGDVVQRLYGVDPHGWIGKSLTLYPTTTQVGRETVDCIRIRPKKPGGAVSAPVQEEEVQADE